MKNEAMSTLIHHYAESSGFNDDDYYYLVFDEDSGNLMVEHSWHYWRPSGINEGEKLFTLQELKKRKPAVYRMALALLKAKLFS